MITRLKFLHRALIGGVAALLVAGSALAPARAHEVIKTSTTKKRSDNTQNAPKRETNRSKSGPWNTFTTTGQAAA